MNLIVPSLILFPWYLCHIDLLACWRECHECFAQRLFEGPHQGGIGQRHFGRKAELVANFYIPSSIVWHSLTFHHATVFETLWRRTVIKGGAHGAYLLAYFDHVTMFEFLCYKHFECDNAIVWFLPRTAKYAVHGYWKSIAVLCQNLSQISACCFRLWFGNYFHPFHSQSFHSQVLYDATLHTFLDSYLHYAPRWDATGMKKKWMHWSS